MTSDAEAGATILTFTRGADGRLEQTGAVGPMGAIARGLIVDPQGRRVYYGHPADAIFFRDINGDGSLGAERAFPIGNASTSLTAYAQYLAMTPDGRNLYAAQYVARGGLLVWQSTIDPATGVGTPKDSPFVAFPAAADGPTPHGAGRLAISPSGSHLYAAADTHGVGIGRWAIEPASGTLTGGTLEAPPAYGETEAAVALSAGGGALWAPSAGGAGSGDGRIRQFSVGADGALAPLAPPAAGFAVASPAHDLILSPNGATLYLGQSGTVGAWTAGAGGTLTYQANAPAAPDPAVLNAGIALAPSQPPVAAFTATAASAGRGSVFDARASRDPDGTIARYDWSFGDGTTVLDGGPLVRHVYTTRGKRTVTLTVTDADGTSTERLWTGARMLRNGGPTAQATRRVTITAAGAVRPRKGRSVTLTAVSGTILVRVPGSRRFVPIDELSVIPLGSIIDARKGKARITSEVNARTRRTQSAIFYDWYFKVLQTKGTRPITEARLTRGSFASCPASRLTRLAVAAKAAQRSRKRVRRLWGNGRGNFRTGGRRSSATVRGTRWLVEDRCDGTLTRVTRGRVDVRVFRTKKVVRLWKKPGRRSSYLAR
jgi:hypothetical protein